MINVPFVSLKSEPNQEIFISISSIDPENNSRIVKKRIDFACVDEALITVECDDMQVVWFKESEE